MANSLLLVDDSAPIRDLLSTKLREAGMDVLTASDGAEALKVADGKQLDLVVTDLNMPILNGLELAERLRATPEFRSLPILMHTIDATEEMKDRGREIGVTGWIVKPIDPHALVTIARRFVR